MMFPTCPDMLAPVIGACLINQMAAGPADWDGADVAAWLGSVGQRDVVDDLRGITGSQLLALSQDKLGDLVPGLSLERANHLYDVIRLRLPSGLADEIGVPYIPPDALTPFLSPAKPQTHRNSAGREPLERDRTDRTTPTPPPPLPTLTPRPIATAKTISTLRHTGPAGDRATVPRILNTGDRVVVFREVSHYGELHPFT